MEDIKKIEQYLEDYLTNFDGVLFRVEKEIDDTNVVKILRSGWVTISKSSAWYLSNYRANCGNENQIFPVTYYMLSFSCRLILETSSDIYYLLNNQTEVPKFLNEYEGFVHGADIVLLKKLRNVNYHSEFILDKRTATRIKACYGDRGVVDYNLLCLNTHFNYIGYTLTKNETNTIGIRIGNLRFILDALNKFFDSIENICNPDILLPLIDKRNLSKEITKKIFQLAENWKDIK